MIEINKYEDRLERAGLQNPVIKTAFRLLKNSGANPKRLFVTEGIWALEKIVEYKTAIDTFILCPELVHSLEARNIAEYIVNTASRSVIVSEKVFRRLSERDNPDGLFVIAKLPEFSFDSISLKKNALVVVLDSLEIPGNVGTIIRSVDGAGGDGVILVNRKVRLGHPKLIRGSHAAGFKVPVVEADAGGTMEWLKVNGFTVYLTDTRADCSYYQTDYPGRVAIIAGNEKHGISREWYEGPHHLISIPMLGRCDSLNVGVATSIVAYEVSLRHRGYTREAAGTSSTGSPHCIRHHFGANTGMVIGFPPWARDSDERKATAVHSAAV